MCVRATGSRPVGSQRAEGVSPYVRQVQANVTAELNYDAARKEQLALYPPVSVDAATEAARRARRLPTQQREMRQVVDAQEPFILPSLPRSARVAIAPVHPAGESVGADDERRLIRASVQELRRGGDAEEETCDGGRRRRREKERPPPSPAQRGCRSTQR